MCKEYGLNYELDKRIRGLADFESEGEYAFEEKFEAGDIGIFNDELDMMIECAKRGDISGVERISDYLAIKMAYGEAAEIIGYKDGLFYVRIEL